MKNKDKKYYEYFPKVGVIVPCKNLIMGFEENINALCTLDYPSYDIVFVIDSKIDPVYNILKEICKKCEHARIIISDYKEKCSGKISALITGVDQIGDVEVYVFADCDIKPHKIWLKKLVSFLSEKKNWCNNRFSLVFS